MRRITPPLLLCALAVATAAIEPRAGADALRVGAAAVDVSPTKFPVIVNGGFLANHADGIVDPLSARCIAFDDGVERLAIMVVDSCMMPRELLDRAKKAAHEKTGIPVDRILISATHTHTAASCMPALGTPVDPAYAELLPGKLAEAVVAAHSRLEPAEIGWAAVEDHKHTHNRRWIRRPDKLIEDPFGVQSARANMHPGYVSPDAIAPAGPVDPGLTVVSIRSKSGRSDAVLANYSMHYYGSHPVSADYYGRFRNRLADLIGEENEGRKPLVIMSQGTSGDLMWMDYGAPQVNPGLDRFADEVARVALGAYQKIQYQANPKLAMAEQTLTLSRRLPDADRLAWARDVAAKMGDRLPKSKPEVYAKEALFIHDEPKRELKIQAIRIGDLGIAAIPNEVYAISGLKIKARSPLATTFNIELANGGDGYIPPPEQHALGGYTTWPARTAGLEVQAEPRIVETVLTLLEKVAGAPRRAIPDARSPYAEAVLASKPAAFWRLDDMEGAAPRDSSGRNRPARLEPGFALYLPGADGAGLSNGGAISRAVHLAGGRLKAGLAGSGERYAVEFWFWNGLPNGVRDVTGTLATIGEGESAQILAIDRKGRLTRSEGGAPPAQTGPTEIPLKTWQHVVFARDGRRIAVYLNGNPQPELTAEAGAAASASSQETPVVVGDGGASASSFEGKIDEVAVYDRALSAAEAAGHYRAARP